MNRIPFGGALGTFRTVRLWLLTVLLLVIAGTLLVLTLGIRGVVPWGDVGFLAALATLIAAIGVIARAFIEVRGFGRFRILNGSKNKKIKKLRVKVDGAEEESHPIEPPLPAGACDNSESGPDGFGVNRVEITAELEDDQGNSSEVRVVMDGIGAPNGIEEGRLVLAPHEKLFLIVDKGGGEILCEPQD